MATRRQKRADIAVTVHATGPVGSAVRHDAVYFDRVLPSNYNLFVRKMKGAATPKYIDLHMHDVLADMTFVHVRYYTSDGGHSGTDTDALCEDQD